MAHLLRIAAVTAASCCAVLIAAPIATSDPFEPVLSADLGSSTPALASKMIARLIVPPHHFAAFDSIITHESGWNTFAINPASGAYGLGQALPPEKMSSHGWDWQFNPLTQIRWAYDYMNLRYGSPEAAWVFWQAHHWY
ncbi:lytic transglycosylase domain-containing protein [Nocardia panacis]|uniref:Lytic transglycosylase domain-containing protein n=1 Tax=Nocardia panacis TaxID=2340916 RepID=A0A3A4KP92_9NOCA|nr:transglycosylase SLT domain-containing protein [Nocardia panacis]RJO79272.1 lytic transglycosylase domain-containing protein [Nocardia panacis]